MLLHELDDLVKGFVHGLVWSHEITDKLIRSRSTDAQQDSALLLGTCHVVGQEVLFQAFAVRRPVFFCTVEFPDSAVSRL